MLGYLVPGALLIETMQSHGVDSFQVFLADLSGVLACIDGLLLVLQLSRHGDRALLRRLVPAENR